MSDTRARGEEAVTRCADELQQPSETEVRAELERILASRCFQQAGRASHFLRFVVEQTLAGAGQRLKGYTIGVEVFGRPADFDAQSDALVRVEAGRLRRRLVEYYASEGVHNPLRIELPRGSYAVEYHTVDLDGSAGANAAAPAVAAPHSAGRGPFPWQRVAAALTVLLVAALGVMAWQHVALRDASNALQSLSETQLTEWPRIVVVPFENLGADEALDVIAASMTEEIMLRLDELDLFVVASQASWYGASHEKSRDLSSAGGYLLTGSVRGTATEARITVRLIEAKTGGQLWTAAYDEPLAIEQLPALQEQVARDVAAIAAPYGPIFEAELARARRSVQAPTLRDCLATYYDYRRRMASEAHEFALACFRSVSTRQPDVAQAWSGIAMLHVDRYASTFSRTGDGALEAARAATNKALALDRDDFLANLALSRLQFFDGDPAFRQSIERTLELRPGSTQALAQGGFMLAVTGDSARGLLLIQKAQALSKTPLGLYHLAYAVTYLREGRFAEALACAQKVSAQNWVLAQAVTAAAAAHSGRPDVARQAAQRIRELYPEFELEAIENFEHWHFDAGFYDALLSGLGAAGLLLRDRHVPVSGG
jgi:adenylate cyclase